MKRRVVILGIATATIAGLLLWLYSHKLWSSAEDRRLDSLLRLSPPLSPAGNADSLVQDSAAGEFTTQTSLLDTGVSAAVLPTWESAAGRPPRCPHCLAIAIIGVDARLGDPTPHADANHVLLLDLTSGRITIVAIPRDTPADAGFPDTSQYNKLANVRAHRGLRAHLATLAELVGIPTIHYYVELGFSQAFGLLRLLRFDNPTDVLRVLRARTGIWGDDYHRVYVQAQFIRQQLLRWFDTYDTPWGLALLRGALALVQTNLTVGVLTRLADSLRAHGFPTDSDAIRIVVYNVPLRRAPVYDLTDPQTFRLLAERLRQFHRRHHPTAQPDSHAQRVRHVLSSALSRAEQAAQAHRFGDVIRILSPLIRQRAWWQLEQPEERAAYRTALIRLASQAYERLRKPQQAAFLRNELLRQEEELEASVLSSPAEEPSP